MCNIPTHHANNSPHPQPGGSIAATLKERMAHLRTLAQSQPRRMVQLVNPCVGARYDSIYLDGIQWLNELD